MKLAVSILIMLGMLAAGAAVLLVQTIGDRFAGEKPEDTAAVLLAQADLPARTQLTAEHIKVATVPEEGLPPGCYTDPAQAIGKILKLDLAKGQPITGELVTTERNIADLLRPGMRAFNVPLKRDTGVGLLEPGCVVDVHVTFPLRNKDLGEALVIAPLLQQLRVLAVDGQTVVSQHEGRTVARQSSSVARSVTATLEVTDAQASVLQLALKEGTLALLLRNATDYAFKPVQPLVVKDGRYTPHGEPLDPQDPAGLIVRVRQVMDQSLAVPVPEETASADPNDTPAIPMPLRPQPARREKRAVEYEIIRGPIRTTEPIPVKAEKEPTEDAEG